MSPREAVSRLVYGITHPEQELTRLQAFVRDSYHHIAHAYQILMGGRAPQLAAALAYRTLFSLVPVLALTLVVLRGVFGEEGIRTGMDRLMDFLGLDHLSLSPQVEGPPAPAPLMLPETADPAMGGPGLAEQIERFTSNAVDRITDVNIGIITVVSLLVFIYAALSLMIQIEQSFNAVCRARRGRSLMARLTTYWTLLTLGSMLVFVSFIVGSNYLNQFTSVSWLSWAKGPLGWLTDIGSVWLVLIFAFTQMPTARVKLYPAAIGAFLSAVVWTACRSGLQWFVSNMSSAQVAVYGALAVLPLFLLWVYVTWFTILGGLAVAWSIQTAKSAIRRGEKEETPDTVLVDPLAVVAVLRLAGEAFTRGRRVGIAEFVERLGLPRRPIEMITDKLVERGFLHRLGDDAGPSARFVLALPADKIMLDDALRSVQAVTATGREVGAETPGPDATRINELREVQLDSLKGVSLAGVIGDQS